MQTHASEMAKGLIITVMFCHTKYTQGLCSKLQSGWTASLRCEHRNTGRKSLFSAGKKWGEWVKWDGKIEERNHINSCSLSGKPKGEMKVKITKPEYHVQWTSNSVYIY